MSRNCDFEVDVAIDLRATTALHVGGIGGETEADLLVAVDGRGNVLVPGTSLAGAIREWMRGLVEDKPGQFASLWGWIATEVDEGKGFASRIIIEDAVVELDGNPVRPTQLGLRHNISIDRRWGTVSDGLLYTRQVVPAGTVIPLRFTIEGEGETTEAERLVAALVAATKRGHIRIGAASSRGLGRVELHGPVRWRICDYRSAAGLLATLRDRAAQQWQVWSDDASVEPYRDSRPRMHLEIQWEARGPIMSKAAVDGLAVDQLPETSRQDGNVHLLLAGSSIRGALRSEAEAIVRTVLDVDDAEMTHIAHEALSLPLIDELFGAAAMKGTNNGAGALSIADCISAAGVGLDKWQAFEFAAPSDRRKKDRGKPEEDKSQGNKNAKPKPDHLAQLRAEIEALVKEGLSLDIAFHVTLDRFTGGAADSMLFTAVEPWDVKWRPFEFDIDLSRKGLNPAAVFLLLMTLNRVNHGAVQFGHGVNRGYGDAVIRSVYITGENLAEPYASLVTDDPVAIAQLDAERLRQAWIEWSSNPKPKAEVEAGA